MLASGFRSLARVLGCVLAMASLAGAQPRTLASTEDAFVRLDEGERVWEIGNSGIRAQFGFDRDGNFLLQHVVVPGGARWTTSEMGDSLVTISGRQSRVGTRTWQFEGVSSAPRGPGVEIVFTFRAGDSGARVERHYACYPTAPVIEAWTVVAPLDAGRALQLSNLNGLDIRIRPGTIRWVTGLNTPQADGGPFTLAWEDLDDGRQVEIGSRNRATELALPWLLIDAPDDAFFAGVLWPGEWQMTAKRSGETIALTAGLPNVQTTITGARELPHVYFGATGGSTRHASEATRAFIAASVRQYRPTVPLVTYNTWFTYGTAVDERSMLAEIAVSASLGVELFVLDAGWYHGSDDGTDFTTGLGSWAVDEERFPSGLSVLRDAAHERGMKFGIWVEPERVDRATVGRPGLALERWLATSGSAYHPGVPQAQAKAAQICLAGREGREWMYQRLVRLIDEVQPDYLKWDNNFWINCDRTGHDHGTKDGNYAHVRGLLDVLERLRERFPDLIVENCSGGGNRLEPSMLAVSDVSWMDDATASGQRIRHHLQGLSTVMPPASLLSFVMTDDWQVADDRTDLPLSFRSRMPGVLGLTWRGPELAEWEFSEIRREIAIYRGLRDVIADASGILLSEQVPLTQASGWEIVQQISASTGDVLLFAYENDHAEQRIRIRPRRLDPDAVYRVVSVDRGELGSVTGEELMTGGIEVASWPQSRAHVLRLTLDSRGAR